MANTKLEKTFKVDKEILRIKSADFADFLLKKKVVKLTGVGVFSLIYKKPYMGYHPAKKKIALVSGGVRISFRPDRNLKLTIKEHVKNKNTKVA